MTEYENIGRIDLVIAGRVFAPGARIPIHLDPPQLAYFAARELVRLVAATPPLQEPPEPVDLHVADRFADPMDEE